MKHRFHKIRFFVLILFLAAAFCFVGLKISGKQLTYEMIVKYTPSDPVPAAFILLFLFGLKSISFVIPVGVLYLAGGIMFPPAAAIIINMAGLVIAITIPYLAGRIWGGELLKMVKKKHPEVETLEAYQNKNLFFACFITRAVGILPSDVVSIYFGSARVSYAVYVLAGLLGSALSILTTTLLGEAADDPFSIEFLFVLILRVLVIILSIGMNYLIHKKIK